MQVMYLHQQQARKLKASEGRVAEGVSVHSLPDGAGLGIETRLFTLDPDGVLASSQGEGERHFFVLSGVGEVSAARSEVTQPLNKGALLSINADEGFKIRNTGNALLTLLYIRPTGLGATTSPEADTSPTTTSAEVAAVAPTATAGKGKRQATQVREQPAPATAPAAPAPPAAAPTNPSLPGDDDGSESSRTFRLVFEGGSDEQGKGFGNYRIYPPIMEGQRPPTIIERVDFDEMPPAQAAYQTLIHALEDLTARLQEADQEPSDWQVDVSGNNRMVVRQVQGEAQPRSAKAIELLEEAQGLLAQFGGFTLSYNEVTS